MLRTPGLKVVCPATAEDAGLLLGAAVRDPNPVLLFEQKSLYFRIKGRSSTTLRRRFTARGCGVRAPT